MNARVLLVASTLSGLALACKPAARPIGEAVEALVSDAVHSGAAGFYFLPPLVAAPTLVGTFDADLSPIVRIDQLDANASPVETIATFTMTSGPGYETIRLDPSGPSYILNWHTKRFGLDPGTYRANILLDAREIGFIDIDVVASGRAKGPHRGPCPSVLNGSTIPIKFWMNTCVPIVCTGADACHVAGECDPTTALCSNPNAPDGTPCDDGDACTAVDACASGVCVSGANTCAGCPSADTSLAGIYTGTGTVSSYSTIATWVGPDFTTPSCLQRASTDFVPDVVVEVSGPPYAVSIPNPLPGLNLDLSTPLYGPAWTLAPSGLQILHPYPCIYNQYWEGFEPAIFTIDPAQGTASFHAYCRTGHLDACGFSPNTASDWELALRLRCVPNQTVNIGGWAVTCDANGTITSRVPCTTTPAPCAAPLPDACGLGTAEFCTTLSGDRDNCGHCGRACAAWETCTQGACVALCSSSLTACEHPYPDDPRAGVTCADLSSDSNNCGICDRVCSPLETCSGGQCVDICPASTPDGCSNTYGEPQFCTNTQTDRSNCGYCFSACAATQSCVSGQCTDGCQGPTPDTCDGACTNVQTDLLNCGACGVACPARATCSAGVCACPPSAPDLCGACTDVRWDRENCGACGNICPVAGICGYGHCT
jgi:stigma-specific protein Stig1